MTMSETELNQFKLAILAAIHEQQDAKPKGEKYLTQGVMLITLAAIAFIGTTVWQNSIKIEGLVVGVSGLKANFELATKNRFTSIEGISLKQRVTAVEKDLQELKADEAESHAALDKHLSLSLMRHAGIQKQLKHLSSKLE